MSRPISILGIFVADLTFRTHRMPRQGETVIGNSFKLVREERVQTRQLQHAGQALK